MKYLLVVFDGGGNVNPFLGVAAHLRSRGARVAAVASSTLRDRLHAAGVEVVVSSGAWMPGPASLQAGIASAQPDALVVDFMLTHTLCAAEASGLPTIALIHTLYRELLVDGAPFPMELAGDLSSVNAVRADLGLAAVDGFAELLTAVRRLLVAVPRELDAPGEVPAHAVYTGPLFEGPGPDVSWQPPPGDDPLVVVSASTSTASDIVVPPLQRVLDALDGLPLRVLVTVGPAIDRANLRLPGNATAAPYVRHAAVMPHTSLLVTHAGLGSVNVALAFGVPMVCVPVERDQPANARAVERVRAGCSVEPDATAERIAAAVMNQLSRGGVTMAPDPGALERVLDVP